MKIKLTVLSLVILGSLAFHAAFASSPDESAWLQPYLFRAEQPAVFAPIPAVADIIVDGDPSDWRPWMRLWREEAEDPNIPEEVDIIEIYFMSTPTHMYWRFDTALLTDWEQIGDVAICMDTDNDPAKNAPCGPCSDDYIIRVDPSGQQPVELWDSETCDLVPTSNVEAFSVDRVTEVGIDLADVQITTLPCYPFCYIPVEVMVESAAWDVEERDEMVDILAFTAYHAFFPIISK